MTTIPAQSLYLMNSPFVLRAAEAAAERVLSSASGDEERIRNAYPMFFGRLTRYGPTLTGPIIAVSREEYLRAT